MKHPLEQDDTTQYTPTDIIYIACFYLQTHPTKLIKKSRYKDDIFNRMLIYDLLMSNKTLNLTFQKVGYLFGKHHSTIIHSRDELRNQMDVYAEMRHKLEWLHLQVYGHLDFYTFEFSGVKNRLIHKLDKKVLFDINENLFYELLEIVKKRKMKLSEFVGKCVENSMYSI